MRVNRAKRRWIAWCRYIDATQTQASRSRAWGTDVHNGQVKAHYDVMCARRWVPNGLRAVWYPPLGRVRE